MKDLNLHKFMMLWIFVFVTLFGMKTEAQQTTKTVRTDRVWTYFTKSPEDGFLQVWKKKFGTPIVVNNKSYYPFYTIEAKAYMIDFFGLKDAYIECSGYYNGCEPAFYASWLREEDGVVYSLKPNFDVYDVTTNNDEFVLYDFNLKKDEIFNLNFYGYLAEEDGVLTYESRVASLEEIQIDNETAMQQVIIDNDSQLHISENVIQGIGIIKEGTLDRPYLTLWPNYLGTRIHLYQVYNSKGEIIYKGPNADIVDGSIDDVNTIPSSKYLTLNGDNLQIINEGTLQQLDIFDISGRNIVNEEIYSDTVIPFSNFHPGVYIAILNIGEIRENLKFIVR